MGNNQIQKIFENTIVNFRNDSEVTPEVFLQRQNKIQNIQDQILASPGVQHAEQFNDGKLKHHFAKGVYGRELFIPKDSVIVGKVHKENSVSILAKGTILILCPHNGAQILTAPHTFISKPLTKRVGIAIEDSVWITCHGTDKTNVVECEEELFTDNFYELEINTEDLCQLL